MGLHKPVSKHVKNRVVAKLKAQCTQKTQKEVGQFYGIDARRVSDLICGRSNPGKELATKILGVDIELPVRGGAGGSKPSKLRKPSVVRAGDEPGGGVRDEPVSAQVRSVHGVSGSRLGDDELQLDSPRGRTSAKEKQIRLNKCEEFTKQQEARMKAGLSLLTFKEHVCLSCRNKFDSASNRLCINCRYNSTTALNGVEVY